MRTQKLPRIPNVGGRVAMGGDSRARGRLRSPRVWGACTQSWSPRPTPCPAAARLTPSSRAEALSGTHATQKEKASVPALRPHPLDALPLSSLCCSPTCLPALPLPLPETGCGAWSCFRPFPSLCTVPGALCPHIIPRCLSRPLPPTWGSSLAPSARPTPTSSEAHSAAHRHCEHLADAVPGLWVRGLMGTTAQFLA